MATPNNKKLEDYGSFEWQDYQKTDDQVKAEEALGAWQKPGDFASQYTEAAKQAMEKYMNRDKFSYDLNGDALYQQYKDQYTTQGKLAMQDTIGQASAMTGGYGNSYAQSAGQQAYQGYLQQLNDRVPELYQLALDQYNQEGENLLNQYGLLADRENTEYGRYRDTVSDAYAERDYLTGRADTAYDRGYQEYYNKQSASQEQFNADRGLEYQLDSDLVAFNQAQEQIDNAKEAQDTANNIAWAEYDLKKAAAESNSGLANPLSYDEHDKLLDFAYESYTTGATDRLKIKLGALVEDGRISKDYAKEIWEEYGPYASFHSLKKQIKGISGVTDTIN